MVCGLWVFDDNVAHNIAGMGASVWHNTNASHQIVRYVAYHNSRAGVKHGAYHNNYNYRDRTFYGNGLAGVMLFANTRRLPGRLLFKGCIVNAAGMSEYGLVGDQHHHGLFSVDSLPVLFENCEFVGGTVAGVGHIQNPKPITTCKWDFVNCRFVTRSSRWNDLAGCRGRVQDATRGSKRLVPKAGDSGTYDSEWRQRSPASPHSPEACSARSAVAVGPLACGHVECCEDAADRFLPRAAGGRFR